MCAHEGAAIPERAVDAVEFAREVLARRIVIEQSAIERLGTIVPALARAAPGEAEGEVARRCFVERGQPLGTFRGVVEPRIAGTGQELLTVERERLAMGGQGVLEWQALPRAGERQETVGVGDDQPLVEPIGAVATDADDVAGQAGDLVCWLPSPSVA